tara:strand:+ start:436 stop:1272 length:837 start_codon:yes stop_codon:yes gene_type:complete
MAITNPNLMSGFDTNGTNVTEPSSSQQTDGYTTNEVPLSENHAYMFKQWYDNLQYLKKNGLYQWDASLSYNAGSFIMYDEIIYQSQLDTNSNNLPSTDDGTNWKPLTSDINSYAAKTTPVDADEFVGADSADTFSLKKFTWANIKATLEAKLIWAADTTSYKNSNLNGGAIVEYGSNANGKYTKFADGTLININPLIASDSSNSATKTIDITFASSFIDTNYALTPSSLNLAGGFLFSESEQLSKTTSSITQRFVATGEIGTTAVLNISYIAIGRWES